MRCSNWSNSFGCACSNDASPRQLACKQVVCPSTGFATYSAHCSPVMKLLTGAEFLLRKAEEWDQSAPRSMSVAAAIAPLSQLIARWRRVRASFCLFLNHYCSDGAALMAQSLVGARRELQKHCSAGLLSLVWTHSSQQRRWVLVGALL